MPATRTRAEYGPRVVSSSQRDSRAFHCARVTSTPYRILGVTPNRDAVSARYARISACPAKARVHPGFGANEYEYSADGTSHAQPGYVLSRQVPPSEPAFSSTARSSTPAWPSRMAAPSPDAPAPTTRTAKWRCSIFGD